MTLSQRLRTCAKHTGLDSVIELLTEAADEIDALQARAILAQQPATGEPVQADSSEHLRVIASLGAALRRLSFAAQTTGGTDGPDAELQSAIGQAEQALSLGGIWQAMSATGEPVEDGIRNAEDELNCAEEVLDAITCEFPDGEFPVTDFNCIGDYITAVVDVFKERLAAQQPATGEPVYWEWRHLSTHPDTVDFGKWSEWKRVEARSAIHTIEDALAEFRAYIAQGYKYELRALYDHPAPSVPDEKPLPDLMMASYHEAIGWNACRAAMLAAK